MDKEFIFGVGGLFALALSVLVFDGIDKHEKMECAKYALSKNYSASDVKAICCK